ncbi:MAG TPA: TonB family protein [Deltaproteobacteria bacterium]|nr:TonB family protein [Deltaproteobacteria bacterium]
MKELSWYIGISLVLHAVLIGALVDIEFSRTEIPSYDVYEVSIVSSVPTASRPASPAKTAPGAKKYVYHRGSDTSSISSIKKDRAIKDRAPELKPADIEPIKPAEEEPSPDITPSGTDELSQRLKEYEAARTPGPSGASSLSSNPVSIWKAQVRSLVDGLWKTPPEISIMDMSLKTTYLLKISRSGVLLDKKLLVSSGNSPFDRSVLLALSSVSKLPVPPLVLIAGRDTVEITMSFTPPEGAN